MAPQPVKSGSPRKKQRVKSGDNVHESKFSNHVSKEEYVLCNPRTQLVCQCCFSQVADITQHTQKAGGCALFVACNHVMHCFQENGDGFVPDATIVSVMLQDKECEVNALDILHQSDSWDPSKKFEAAEHGEYGYTVATDLLTKNFKDLYDAYVQKYPRLIVNGDFKDILHLATQKATSVKNLNPSINKMWTQYVDNDEERAQATAQRIINDKIASGDLIPKDKLNEFLFINGAITNLSGFDVAAMDHVRKSLREKTTRITDLPGWNDSVKDSVKEYIQKTNIASLPGWKESVQEHIQELVRQGKLKSV